MNRPFGIQITAFLALLLISGSAFAGGDPAEQKAVEQDPNALPPSGTSGHLLLTGALVTAGWYGAAVGTSYLWPNSPGARQLRIPVVGPTLALTKTACGHDERHCNTFTLIVRSLFTTLSAVGQVGGLVVMGEALFLPTQPKAALVDSPSRSWSAERLEERARVSAFPLVTEDGMLGIGISGVF